MLSPEQKAYVEAAIVAAKLVPKAASSILIDTLNTLQSVGLLTKEQVREIHEEFARAKDG